MADLWLDFGTDLNFGPTGDLATADGLTLTNQRLARRYFTNPARPGPDGRPLGPADYIFHPDYGAGIRGMVDELANANVVRRIQALMIGQAKLEATVAKSPIPSISGSFSPGGELDISLKYFSANGTLGRASFVLSA